MIAGLPYDAEIEYLESTGTQYIDTGFSLSTASRIVFSVNTLRNGTASQWCVLGANSSSNEVLLWYRGAEATYLNGKKISIPFQYNKRYYVDLVVSNGSASVTVDGILQGTSTGRNNGKRIYLFGSIASVSGTVRDSYNYQRIYEFSLYDQNGTLVRDFVPVRAGNVGYLYDRVTKKLFGNQGTGNFVLGPDVATPVMGLRGMKKFYNAWDYIQDGLIAMWDGIENAGWGKHDSTATKWVDLTGNGHDATRISSGTTWTGESLKRTSMEYGLTWLADTSLNVSNVEIVFRSDSNTSTNVYQLLVTPNVAANLAIADVETYFGGGDAPNGGKYAKKLTNNVRHSVGRAMNLPNRGVSSAWCDGQMVSSADRATYWPASRFTSGIGFGGSTTRWQGFPGEIFCIRLYSRALTAEEVAHNYLVDKYRFNLP